MLKLLFCCFSGLLVFTIHALPAFAQGEAQSNEASAATDGEKSVEKSAEPIEKADDAKQIGDKPSYELPRGTKEYMFEPGYSPFEPTHFAGPKEYNTAGRKLGTLNFRIGRVIGTKKAITYEYLFGFTPFVISLKNEVKNSAYVSETATPDIPPTKRETSYGVAVQPANFRFIFFPKSRVKPFAQVGAGILITNKAMPLPVSRNFNFTGDFGGGLQIFTSHNRAMTLGYRYYHISNGNLTPKKYNVGYNANVFYIGYSIFK
jgi:opacity protein-like surface antigen